MGIQELDPECVSSHVSESIPVLGAQSWSWPLPAPASVEAAPKYQWYLGLDQRRHFSRIGVVHPTTIYSLAGRSRFVAYHWDPGIRSWAGYLLVPNRPQPHANAPCWKDSISASMEVRDVQLASGMSSWGWNIPCWIQLRCAFPLPVCHCLVSQRPGVPARGGHWSCAGRTR